MFNDGLRREQSTDRLEKRVKAVVRNTVSQWDVDRITLAPLHAHILLHVQPRSHGRHKAYSDVTGTWEELSKSVERRCHDPIGSIESLFHAITVVYINVNIQDSWMYPASVS